MPPKNDSRFRRRDRRPREVLVADSTNFPFPEGMVFYCKNRKQIVDIRPKTFDFKAELDRFAEESGTKDLPFYLVYGTERSIKQYFKISDAKFDLERRERETKANQADKYG